MVKAEVGEILVGATAFQTSPSLEVVVVCLLNRLGKFEFANQINQNRILFTARSPLTLL